MFNFHSNSPALHKRSCIKALFSRIHTHCRIPVARKAEKAHLYEMLQSNGYPINIIKQATRPPRGTTTTSNEPENAQPTIWRSLPYIKGISESVARRLIPYNVKIANKPHSVLRSNLVHVKDPIPTLQRRKVIYQIPCSGCDKTYTGQTGRLVGTWLKEHRGSVRRHDTNSGGVETSVFDIQLSRRAHKLTFHIPHCITSLRPPPSL